MTTRLEATLPAPRIAQLQKLAAELQMSKSDLVAEAVTILLEAAAETRRGHRLAFVGREHTAVREIALPSLSQLSWAAHLEKVPLSAKAHRAAKRVLGRPAKPTRALKRAFAQRAAR